MEDSLGVGPTLAYLPYLTVLYSHHRQACRFGPVSSLVDHKGVFGKPMPPMHPMLPPSHPCSQSQRFEIARYLTGMYDWVLF